MEVISIYNLKKLISYEKDIKHSISNDILHSFILSSEYK